jgi:hypothetical protein
VEAMSESDVDSPCPRESEYVCPFDKSESEEESEEDDEESEEDEESEDDEESEEDEESES